MLYILEVQKFTEEDIEICKKYNGKFEHVGYINKIFESIEEASTFYKSKNPGMRDINSRMCSDWHPKTRYRVVIREYNGEMLKPNITVKSTLEDFK